MRIFQCILSENVVVNEQIEADAQAKADDAMRSFCPTVLESIASFRMRFSLFSSHRSAQHQNADACDQHCSSPNSPICVAIDNLTSGTHFGQKFLIYT